MFDLKGIDFTLLQEQRNTLLDVIDSNAHSSEEKEKVEGVVTLLDEILDVALDQKLCALDDEGWVREALA